MFIQGDKGYRLQRSTNTLVPSAAAVAIGETWFADRVDGAAIRDDQVYFASMDATFGWLRRLTASGTLEPVYVGPLYPFVMRPSGPLEFFYREPSGGTVMRLTL